MADAKISQLPTGSPPVAADLIPVAQEVSPGVYETIQVPYSALQEDFVSTDGDTITGTLTFTQVGGESDWDLSSDIDGNFTITAGDQNQILNLNAGTAAAGNTGQTITGRLRYAMPIVVQNTAATLGSGAAGITTALVRCSNGSAVTLTIRDNTGGATDFDAGAFFSVMQEGLGQVTLVGETGDVDLMIPAGFIAATRDQYSVISATLYDITEGVQSWLISGDLAEVA